MKNKQNGIPCKNCGHLYWHWDHCCDDFNPDEKKISIKKKIDFILKKCGGESLSHVLSIISKSKDGELMLSEGLSFFLDDITLLKYREFKCYCGDGACDCAQWYDFFGWQLLIDTKEAKLQDQSDETILAIYKILGGE